MASKNELYKHVIDAYKIEEGIQKKFYHIPLKHLQTMAILYDYAEGDTYATIAKRYKITARAVEYIIKGR